MNIIFQIEGGIGKSIMATAVCEAIKKKYSKSRLIVITAYPDVFMCNPHIDKCFGFNELKYFYRDYIEGKEVKTFLHNPYFETSFINQDKHLLEIWCEMFGVKYNGEKPNLYITDREKVFYSNQFKTNKPIMVIQTNGGAENQQIKYSWARDIPKKTAQKIVNELKNEYDIIHIRRDDQFSLENTIPISSNFRSLAVLIGMSTKRLFMDSFAQHTAKALGLDSVVCWIANNPKVFGYENNTNIICNDFTIEPEIKNSIFTKFNISGDLMEFPYNNEDEIFNVEEIIESLKK